MKTLLDVGIWAVLLSASRAFADVAPPKGVLSSSEPASNMTLLFYAVVIAAVARLILLALKRSGSPKALHRQNLPEGGLPALGKSEEGEEPGRGNDR